MVLMRYEGKKWWAVRIAKEFDTRGGRKREKLP
jgi:hypothetical protein